MSSSVRHSICAQGGKVRKEKLAGEAGILPGHLLEFSSGEVVTHNVADGVARPIRVAVESDTVNPSATAIIDVPYADGDNVYYVVGQPGDVLYMLLADGQNAVEGVSVLVSNADGTLKIAAAVDATLIAGAQVGVPAESLNNSSGNPARLLVELV